MTHTPPQGHLQPLAANLWVVDGTIRMPPGPLPRRMTIARLANGELVAFSVIALDEAGMRAIEALGRPTYMVVPNPFHRQDAAAWKARYPDLQVVAPRGARSAVEEIVPVDDTEGVFPDASVQFVTIPGTADAESALVVRSTGETTLVVNDIIGNVQDAKGLMKLVLRAMGFAGREPQVPRMYKARGIKDPAAVAGQFRAWAQLADLKRIIVSHGRIIESDPAGLLQRLAAKLS